jgi:hypothetical protein
VAEEWARLGAGLVTVAGCSAEVVPAGEGGDLLALLAHVGGGRRDDQAGTGPDPGT